MKNIRSKIETIKKFGYPLQFDSTFNHATAVYKKIAMPAGLAFLLFGFVYFVVASTLSVGAMNLDSMSPNADFGTLMKELKFQLENMPLQQQIIDAVIRIVFGVIFIPLMAGVIKLCHDSDTGKEIAFGNLFRYYAGPHFSDLFIGALLINLVTFFIGMASQYLLPYSLGLGILLFVLSLIVSVLTTLFVPLVIFGNLPPIEAITSSIALVGKKFGTIFLLLIVASLLAMLGVFACCIGLAFTLPLLGAAQYSIYVHSIGFDENEETSELS